MKYATRLNGTYEPDGSFRGLRHEPAQPTTAATHYADRGGLCLVLGLNPATTGPRALAALIMAAHDAVRVVIAALGFPADDAELWERARELARPTGDQPPWCPATRAGARAAVLQTCLGACRVEPAPADFVGLIRQRFDTLRAVERCTGLSADDPGYRSALARFCAWPYDAQDPAPEEPCQCDHPRQAGRG